MPEVGDLIDDRYELLRKAGEGMSSVVWRAFDRSDSAPTALKLFQNAASAGPRFAVEMESLKALDHPNLVKYRSHGRWGDDGLYLALEWVEGESLSAALQRGPMSRDEALKLGYQLALLLAYMHKRGFVHRDVKPNNIVLVRGDAGVPKLLDLGLARPESGFHNELTSPGTVLGTPGFMSPEQARGESELDGRTDVFALGCVLYTCLTGVEPFAAGHALASMIKVILEEPTLPSEIDTTIPPALERLILGMMIKNRASRPDAEAAAASLSVAARPNLPTGPMRLSALSPRDGLHDAERRILCAMLACGAEAAAGLPPSIGEEVERLGGRVEHLADGSLVVVVDSDAAKFRGARGLVGTAARCALNVRQSLPHARIALATGRGEGGARLPSSSMM